MRLPRAWFLPETHDVLSTLTAQLDIVQTVIGVLRAWCARTGEEDTIGQLRSLLATEHETRRRLHTQVRASFSTPLAAEDLFELTERLGAVSERAYGVAREAELSRTAPDPRLGQQVEAIAAAMTPLGAAIRALPDSHAAPLADQALEQLTLAEHAYREAIADLESETDLRRELRRREQYRRCELLAEAVQHLARRTWHAVYKSQKDIKSGPPVLACLPDAASMAQGRPRSGTSAPGQIAHLLGDSGHRLGDRVCASAAVSVASAAGLEHRSGALP